MTREIVSQSGCIKKFLGIIHPDDGELALVIINRHTQEVTERYTTPAQISKYIPYLRHCNATGCDIYFTPSQLKPKSRKRTKSQFQDLQQTTYLEFDKPNTLDNQRSSPTTHILAAHAAPNRGVIMQATARQKKIDYQFAPMPKGSALMLWQVSNDFTPILFMHICEQLNGYSKELLTYKITDAALIELYQVCQRTITRARTKLLGADVVEAIEVNKGVFCYRPSKTSRLKRQMCLEVVTDVSKTESEPKPDSDKAQTQTGGGLLEYKPKNINNPPTSPSITNCKLGAKEGGGKFNKVKQALEAKDNSYIPPDKQIQEVIEQIPHDKAQESLIYAIRSVDIPRIASLPKLFEAARKKEGQFWELIKGYPEYLQAEERSKRDRQTTRHEIKQRRGPDQSKRGPEPEREKPESIDKDHQRVITALAGFGKSAVKPVTEVKPWSREDALKLDRERRK